MRTGIAPPECLTGRFFRTSEAYTGTLELCYSYAQMVDSEINSLSGQRQFY
jgi:hypothetical protein